MHDTPIIDPLDALIREICGSPEAEHFGALSAACQNLGATMVQPGSASANHQPPPGAVEYHPAKRGIQIADATDMTARPDRHDDGYLISACAIILANSLDHCAREWARQLALVPGCDTPGRMSA